MQKFATGARKKGGWKKNDAESAHADSFSVKRNKTPFQKVKRIRLFFDDAERNTTACWKEGCKEKQSQSSWKEQEKGASDQEESQIKKIVCVAPFNF